MANQDTSEPGSSQNHKMMTLFEHLDELRSRIVKSLLAILIIFAAAMFFSTEIIGILKLPLSAALPAGSNSLHFTGPMDVFVAQIQVAVMISILFACPFWLYQLWSFVEPALYPTEKRYARPFLVAAVLLFFAGVSFCYFAILPTGMSILIGIGTEAGATAMITINDYFSLLTVMMLGFGVVFELPVVLILLGLLDIVSAKGLSEYRRAIYVLILIVAAVLTPPDPFSQLAMAIPMVLMFEVAILVLKIIKKPAEDPLARPVL
jgi:sec-independent protein translocase protein TatC